MRKGAKRSDWTTADIAYLVEHAGRKPVRDLCRELRRSSQALYSKARHLRDKGTPVGLRYFTPMTGICPGCGCSRSTMGKDGICKLCRKREQLANIESRIAELWPLLDQKDRDKYEQTEAERESRIDPRPKPPQIPDGATYYERMKARERWEAAVEAADIRNIEREIKAAQKRKERIEKKVKSMPNRENAQIGEEKCSE